MNEFPSFRYLLERFAMIKVDNTKEPVVITSGESVDTAASMFITPENSTQDLERVFNLKWPNWRREYEFLKCTSHEEFQVRFQEILNMWAKWIPVNKNYEPRYVPPEQQAEYLAAKAEKRSPKYNLFVNPLCLNSKLAILAAKVNDGLFRIVYTKIGDENCGLYKDTQLTAAYFAGCALHDNEPRGIIATARELILFELTVKPSIFVIQKSFPNPFYKETSPDVAEAYLDNEYPAMCLATTREFLLVAKHAGPTAVIELEKGTTLYNLNQPTTSLFINSTELSLGTSHGQILRFSYVWENGQLLFEREEKNVQTYAKTYTLTDGSKIQMDMKEILCHYNSPFRAMVGMNQGLICQNTHPAINAIPINQELKGAVNISVLGDLMFVLMDNYILHIIVLDSVDPHRTARLCKHEQPIPNGKQMLQLDPDCVRILLFDGAIITFNLRDVQ